MARRPRPMIEQKLAQGSIAPELTSYRPSPTTAGTTKRRANRGPRPSTLAAVRMPNQDPRNSRVSQTASFAVPLHPRILLMAI